MDTTRQEMTFMAEGRVSHVYLLKDRRVLKLLHASVPPDKVEEEYQRCRLVADAGVPAPRPLERVAMDGRQGIVFEWAGKSDLLTARLSNPLNVPSGGRLMARVHEEILACRCDGLPDIKTEIARMIRTLPHTVIRPDQYPQIGAYLAALPDGNRVCHMDFHPGNIILEGERCQVIDWSEAVKGAPEADIAMSSLMLSMAETAPGTGLLLRLLIPMFRRVFEHYYRTTLLAALDDMAEFRVRQWLLVAAIFRMAAWRIETEREALTRIIHNAVAAI